MITLFPYKHSENKHHNKTLITRIYLKLNNKQQIN